MPVQLTGKLLRLARLSRRADDRFLIVPLDHTITDGPIGTAAGFGRLVGDIAAGGADAIVVHKGRARTLPAAVLADCGLIIHLSASTAHGPDSDAKVVVGTVADAVRLGADAVSVHVNIGSATESRQLADAGAVADECERWGVPLLAMMYPRGPRISSQFDPDLLAHVATVAADLGADLVKLPLAAPVEAMADVVAASPLPVVVAGGVLAELSGAELATTALAAGCHGLAVGRRVFTSASPRQTVREIAAVIHGGDPDSSTVDSVALELPVPKGNNPRIDDDRMVGAR
ncbi:2-amino-3,7-dideoxy-D-threo-hept-6-ulosonate synthase [Actinokineospora terrae]|uniref:2-amino-4,5-dihydroxy-6-oxo-7-(Phosphonooxy)heptanoate synthase n=1 Tax=Actinokineospora terrae TaxID=155974 RepID=A0A1H9WIR4_9PSEU|nr:2-amino-3,7-dideoxy-D-threo-hept-6-ulosonate synthase [Actinokineospora terrae]SES33816.1 2-amino-4,5-dihydroxy-6-oxo-7-(phosphonooxy)heptanoate synthase [Actinokineospora terrae]